MDTFTIYQRGVDAWTLRQSLRQLVRVSTAQPGEPSSIAARVDMLIDQKRQLEARRARAPQPQSDHNEDLYKRAMEEHDIAIEHLEQLATNAMREHLQNGGVVGLGYLSRKNRYPVPISETEWAFLELDARKSNATFEDGGGYKAIRFIEVGKLKSEELKAIKAALPPVEATPMEQSGDTQAPLITPTNSDGRRDQQIEAILAMIKHQGWNPLSIPYGGKNQLMCLCIDTAPGLFTESGFGHAWQEANDRKVIEVENINQYRHRR